MHTRKSPIKVITGSLYRMSSLIRWGKKLDYILQG